MQNRQQLLLVINIVPEQQLSHRPLVGMVFPITLSSNTRRGRALADTHRVNALAFMRNRTVGTHSPAQHDALACCRCRQIHDGGLKTATAIIRKPAPVWAAGQKRVPEVGVYPRVVVATADKAASCCDDIRESSAVDGDLQHTCIIGGVCILFFQIEVLPEGQLSRSGRDGNAWRVDYVIQNIGWIWREERVWQRVCRRGGHSCIQGYPERKASVIHSLSSYPIRGQRWRRYAIEVLTEANDLRIATGTARYRNIVQIVEVQVIAALELHSCRAAGCLKMVEGEGIKPRNRIEVFKNQDAVK